MILCLHHNPTMYSSIRLFSCYSFFYLAIQCLTALVIEMYLLDLCLPQKQSNRTLSLPLVLVIPHHCPPLAIFVLLQKMKFVDWIWVECDFKLGGEKKKSGRGSAAFDLVHNIESVNSKRLASRNNISIFL